MLSPPEAQVGTDQDLPRAGNSQSGSSVKRSVAWVSGWQGHALRSWNSIEAASTSFPNWRTRSADLDSIFCSRAVPHLRSRSSHRKSKAASAYPSLLRRMRCPHTSLGRAGGAQVLRLLVAHMLSTENPC